MSTKKVHLLPKRNDDRVKAVKNVPLSGFMLEDDFALKLFRECASLLETKLKNRVKTVKNVPSFHVIYEVLS